MALNSEGKRHKYLVCIHYTTIHIVHTCKIWGFHCRYDSSQGLLHCDGVITTQKTLTCIFHSVPVHLTYETQYIGCSRYRGISLDRLFNGMSEWTVRKW